MNPFVVFTPSRHSIYKDSSARLTDHGSNAILPHKARAKLDIRLVPDMTTALTLGQLRNHLSERGFGDIKVNVSGGYEPTQTDLNSDLIGCMRQAYCTLWTAANVLPRNPGSWPGCLFSIHRYGYPLPPSDWDLAVAAERPKVAPRP